MLMRSRNMNFKRKLSIAKEIIWAGLALLAFFAVGLSSVPTHAQELMKRDWGMQAGQGIEVSKAWAASKKVTSLGDCSRSQLVIAIIDTGVDLNHPALKGSLWVNEKEAKGKPGKDDDRNGLDDDIHGY